MRSTDRRTAVLWLNAVAGLGSAKINKLTAEIPPEELYACPEKCFGKAKELIGEAAAKLRFGKSDPKPVEDIMRTLEASGAEFIVRGDAEYPASLENIFNPPAILYYKGDVSLLKSRCLGVVGTREPSMYGRQCTEKFVSALAKLKLTIVSGLARGVDAVAHRTALMNDGKTVAVVATGIDVVFPASNAVLCDDIARKGLVVTEYAPGTPALAYNFPERNRLISGLSAGVLVTEAGLKSGSLITADYAVKQGKELFVIPSALNSPRGAGCNRLLKSLQGAMVLSPDDVSDALGICAAPDEPASVMQLDFTEERILDALAYSEVSFDDLLAITGLGVSDLNALLVRMELNGLIRKLENNYYGV